jgi:hypothetical protein
MTNIAATMAAIMITILSTIPTAVITESSENTKSKSTIWMIAAESEGARLLFLDFS